MPRVRGVSGKGMAHECGETDCVLAGLKALMHSKYGDLILLCSIMLAFLVMLALSAAG
jgi:hypothetical protein